MHVLKCSSHLFSAKDAPNTKCPVQKPYSVLARYSHDYKVVELVLGHATIAEKVDIRTSYCGEDVHLVDLPIKVEYQTERDRSTQTRVALHVSKMAYMATVKHPHSLEIFKITT